MVADGAPPRTRAAVIVALAGPTFKPTGEVAPGTGPLVLVVDNGWASAPLAGGDGRRRIASSTLAAEPTGRSR